MTAALLALVSLARAGEGVPDRDGDGLPDASDPCPLHAAGKEATYLPPGTALPAGVCPDGTPFQRVGVMTESPAAVAQREASGGGVTEGGGPPSVPSVAQPAPAAPSAAPSAPTNTLFSGQGTPWTIGAGNGAVGLFRPLTVGLGARADLTVGTTAVVGLLAPHVAYKRLASEEGHVAYGWEVEAGVPTYGWRQFQTGFLQPIRSDQEVPLAVVVGASPMIGWRDESRVFAAGMRLRVGVPFEEGDVTAQDLVWLDPALAPLTEGCSLQAWGRADWLPTPGWQLTAQGRVELAGGPELQGKLFALRGIGNHVAAGLGVAGAIARETYGWTVPVVVPLQVTPTLDVQGRW